MPGTPRPLLLSCAAVLLALSTTLLGPPVAAQAAPPEAFQQVTLAKGAAELGEPMGLAVLPNRSVLHTSRDGTLRITDASGATKVSGKLAVYSHDEEGLQSVGVDPGFAANRFVYLYYAPPLSTPGGDAPGEGGDFAAWAGVNRLSRFVLNADGTLNLGSEKKVLDVPADRGICCHVGGDIAFDAAGNLYLSTGDDTNPFASDGYSPIDERASRNPSYDAQRTSANTNDLRGKVLRIKVNADGSYTSPSGNLFAPGTARTRPEIYAMGFRNPFRMSVDRATGVVYLGDYGPDAGSASATRGPGGQGGWETFTDVTTGLSGAPAATTTLYLVFKGGAGSLFDLDDFTFTTGTGPITGVGGKCVDMSGANTADGTKVQLWTCNGTGAQKWAAQADGSLRNPQSARCLDAAGAATADGTQLHIWDCHGGANQKWNLPA